MRLTHEFFSEFIAVSFERSFLRALYSLAIPRKYESR